jgi:hypothetical protein
MAVNVRYGSTNRDHDDGVRIEVQDGHLLVKNAEGATVAIYAPAHWSATTATDAQAPRRSI